MSLIFNRFLFFLILANLFPSFSCSDSNIIKFEGNDKKENDDTDDASVIPQNISGSYLTCNFLGQENDLFQYGCTLLDNDGQKLKNSVSNWNISLVNLKEEEIPATNVEENPSSGEMVKFSLTTELVSSGFRLNSEFIVDGIGFKKDSPFPIRKGDCPAGYIKVPKDDEYNLSEFCIMKYEAKSGKEFVKSVPEQIPILTTQTRSKTLCQMLGQNYFLIKNEQWLSLASSIAKVPENWSGGKIGEGEINVGFLAEIGGELVESPSEGTDQDHCYKSNKPCNSAAWSQSKRTHTLSNGEIIWDLVRNAWEWVDFVNKDDKPNPVFPNDQALSTVGIDDPKFDEVEKKRNFYFTKFSDTRLVPTETLPKNNLVITNQTHAWWNDNWLDKWSIGTYLAGYQGKGGAMVRGAELFSVSLELEPDTGGQGFRCVYVP